ncbi:hypothetical protein ccbrp13_69540 [Ktedonobacteria bacterium brp13]|nr:hypothetical protein ccbrp13_69540 [Ktedonobacteria bacterium brp13]
MLEIDENSISSIVRLSFACLRLSLLFVTVQHEDTGFTLWVAYDYSILCPGQKRGYYESC